MTQRRVVLVRSGRLQAAQALVLAGLGAGVVAASSGGQAQLATRLALAGVVMLGAGLALGSPRLVGVTTVPMLAAALISSGAGSETAWVQSIVLGCLWYVTAELAWDAIERRDGAKRTAEFDNRRTQEVATITALSIASTSVGFLFSYLAPTRSILVIGFAVLALFGCLSWATRRLGDPVLRGDQSE